MMKYVDNAGDVLTERELVVSIKQELSDCDIGQALVKYYSGSDLVEELRRLGSPFVMVAEQEAIEHHLNEMLGDGLIEILE